MYSKGVAQYYDLFAGTASEPEEIAFVRALVPAGDVLDIGAGTGRLAFELAARGYKVTALEPDPEMYAALLVRLASRSDLRDSLTPVPRALGFELGVRFDVCLALAVLHLLDPAAQAALFHYAAVHLRSGGRFVVETPVESPLRDEVPHQLKAERTFGDTFFQHHYSMQRAAQGRWLTTWQFTARRGDTVLDQRTRVFDWEPGSLARVTALAHDAGLAVEAAWSDFHGAPFVDGTSKLLVLVARLPA